MSIVLNLFRSVLFFSLCGFGFHSMSDEGSFRLPIDAIAKYKLANLPIASVESAHFIVKKLKVEEEKQIIASVSKNNLSPSRGLASMYDPVESMKKKETLVAQVSSSSMFKSRVNALASSDSNLCSAVKTNNGLDFKTPTSYLSSVLKKAGAVNIHEPLYQDHADQIWDKYLSKNNFEDVSLSLNDGQFSFSKLKNGSLIVLEKSCFKEGTVAVYCDGQYYATKFVRTSTLVKKVNSKSGSCQLGQGMRIVVEKASPAQLQAETLAQAY